MDTIGIGVKRVFLLHLGCLTGAFLLLNACASSAVFTAYPRQIASIKEQIDDDQYQVALETLDKRRQGADKILYLLERGRTAQIARDYETSTRDYEAAIQAIEKNERKARITASGSLATGAAILINDNAIPYEERPYERVFLHHYQALNYLLSGDLEAAAVEARRANEQQQLALDQHEDELAEIEDRHPADLASSNEFTNSFDELRAAAGHVKNSFQNAYTFYLSGVIWEIAGRPNDAYIDYKKALEIFPDNPYVQRDVLRLARDLSMREDLARFEGRFRVEDPDYDAADGEIVVFFDSGYLPEKQEIKIPIATANGLYAVALPTYLREWRRTVPLTLATAKSRTLGVTSPIVNVQALAAKALEEELPGILTRQVLRVAAKVETTRQSRDAFGAVGAVMSNLFNFVTESADLRSWLTLPNEAQIFRASLQPGRHTLVLRSGAFSDTVTVDVERQRTTTLYIVNTGGVMRVSSIVL